MKVLFNNLAKQWDVIKDDTKPRLDLLFEQSNFIGGAPVGQFEENFANYIGTKYAIGISNGTDALKVALEALNVDSPCGVIIPANTFVATILAITYVCKLKADIQLIDCDKYFQMDANLLEKCLKENRNKWKSCVIIPVHLFGHPADIKRIVELASEYDCKILEDSSQSHGALVNNKKVGSFGDISAFSLYPGKNLGAAGDAGVITTDNEDLYQKCKSLRNYGSSKKYYYDFKGYNHRLDTIQAIIVDEKLKHLDTWNNMRIEVAKKFSDQMKDFDNVITPELASYAEKNVFHIYAILIKDRNELQKYLNENGIQTVIHYPIPIQKTKPFSYLDHFNNKNTIQFADEMLSLPMHPFL
ncbi:MAG: DegT/DnrJ/EryC1/StrS family aminotransferase [Promethearchaeota archaeon]